MNIYLKGYDKSFVKILALLQRKKGGIRPYNTKFGLRHLIDMYSDDLSVYLEFKKGREHDNEFNVQCVLQAMEKFKEWSGLKINLGKTYVTIFGRQCNKPKFVDDLQVKWCVEFELLGIHWTLN